MFQASKNQAALPWLNSLKLPQGQQDDIIRTASRGSDITFSINVKERR